MPCPVPAKRHRDPNLPTIWEVPDALWDRIAPIIADLDPPKSTGRPRINARRALDASILRLRSGCQWNHLPNDLPDDSSVHRTLQRWITLGVLDRMWASLIAECDELGGVDWQWQSADAAMGKARLGGPHRPQPDRPRQARREAQPLGGGGGRTAGGGDRRRQRPRHQAAGGHARRHCRRPA